MSVYRLQDRLPDVYCSESRDFQLLCRLYDLMFNNVKYDIDSIVDILDPNTARDTFLKLLATKVGFFSDIDITSNKLRKILKAFPYILKYKGSLKGIRECCIVYIKLHNIIEEPYINIDETNKIVNILIISSQVLTDSYILEELLKYVLPAGYRFKVSFGSVSKGHKIVILDGNTVKYKVVNNGDNNRLREIPENYSIDSIEPDFYNIDNAIDTVSPQKSPSEQGEIN